MITSRPAYWRYGMYDDKWLGPRAILDVAEPCSMEIGLFLPMTDTSSQPKAVEIWANGARVMNVSVARGNGGIRSGAFKVTERSSRVEILCDDPEPSRPDDPRDLYVVVNGVWIEGERYNPPIINDLITRL